MVRAECALHLAALLLLAGCASSLPARLVDTDPAVRENAKKEWTAFSPERQFEVLREGLRRGNDETRRVAALALDARCLSLEEIRLQMAVLAERPNELWESTTRPRLDWVPQHRLPVGSPDVPAIWKASLRAPPSAELVRALSEFHRAALPSHIPDLVALLPKASPDLFPILFWQLQCLASETDEHRAEVARGMVYGLERFRAVSRGAPPPDPLPIHPPEHEVFLALAGATWGLCEDGGFREQHIEAADVYLAAPRAWLHRWAREITLTAVDWPFLARVAAEANEPMAQAWAVRRLAELGDMAALRKFAAGDDDTAFLAAAELAKRGERQRFDEIMEEERDSELAARLLWYADPKAAREEWLRTFQEEQQEARDAAERGEERTVETGLFPEDPQETTDDWGVGIAPADLAWIGEQLLALGAAPELLARYFVDLEPEALTREYERRVLEGLRVVGPNQVDSRFLGLCELRDRSPVVDLLDHWAGTEAARSYALPLLARLGETARAGEMVATWDDWWQDKWVLGRVRDPRVEEFLRAKASEADPTAALDALSTLHGLEDPGISWRNDFHGAEWDKEPFAGARRLIVEGKPVAAVLRLAERDELKEWAAATLAGSRDPATLAFLRRMRVEQWRGVYWVATAALATSGDASAMAEWRAFLAEDRIWLLDVLDDWNVSRWSIFTARGDDALVRHWISRINTNCCLKYYAYCALFVLFPTIALENEGPGDWGQKGKVIRAWFERHPGQFRKSEILGGLVPSR